MTNPQYDRLDNACRRLDSLCARLQRRQQHQAAATADHYLNARMAEILLPARDAVAHYRDFHAQHTNDKGRVDPAQRALFFDVIAAADDSARNLSVLAEGTLNRTGTAPGSQQRLSVLFRKMVADERVEISQIKGALMTVIGQDLTALKRMPRHLRLLSQNNMECSL